MSRVDVRIATAADVGAMFELRTSVRENHLSLEQMADLGITPVSLPALLEGDGRGWVARQGDTLLAFATADAEQASVFAMFVRPGHEGHGLGRRLMTEAEQWLRSRGCREAWLLTDADPHVRAYGFYRHLGWIVDAIEDDGQARFRKRLAEA